jgi:hypothetical protein
LRFRPLVSSSVLLSRAGGWRAAAALRQCWHGAIQCLGRRGQENLGVRDGELDRNEKAGFAGTEMQKGDRPERMNQ